MPRGAEAVGSYPAKTALRTLRSWMISGFTPRICARTQFDARASAVVERGL